jgi:predicted AlkP superfamily phosphohydrolase/phosphomutase
MSQEVIVLKKRVFLVGLDGATFKLINPWIRKGYLPNLKNLIDEGSHGILLSTPEPNSAQAWSSLMTGKNPGKHGLFYFSKRKEGSYEMTLTNASFREGRSLWSIAGQSGKKVIVMNMPMTYPPEEVNGLMISGVDAPGVDCNYTYPPELAMELKSAIGDYILESNFSSLVRQRKMDQAISELKKSVQVRFRAVKYLMEKYPWDIFAVVFVATDRAQHHFWRYMDEKHSLFKRGPSEKYKDTILHIYQEMDNILGEINSNLDRDTILMIVSDHGAGPSSNRAIYINKWLRNEGLLQFKGDVKDDFIHSLYFQTKRNILWNAKYLSKIFLSKKIKDNLKRKFPDVAAKMRTRSLPSLIDWNTTRAYSWETTPSIWINLHGREPGGTVRSDEYETLRDLLIRRLKDFRDPETNQKVVSHVFKREELFNGKHISEAPDLLIEWKDNKYTQRPSFSSKTNESIRVLSGAELERDELFTRPSGIHSPEGIFIIKGDVVSQGKEIPPARIYDIAPTILYILNLPIPYDMDGKVITSVFKDDYVQKGPAQFIEAEDQERSEKTYTPSEEEEIAKRLRNLGYI